MQICGWECARVRVCVSAYCLCLFVLLLLYSYHFRGVLPSPYRTFSINVLSFCPDSMLKGLVSCCGTNYIVLFELRFVRCPVVLRRGPPTCSRPACLPSPSLCLSVCLSAWLAENMKAALV